MSVEYLDQYRELRQHNDGDEMLVLLAKQGNQAAFRQLYDTYIGQVYGLCFRLTANKQMAEEACQEVFLQVWRKLEGFQGNSKFSTWLHKLCCNVTLSYLRKHKSWLSRIIGADDVDATVMEISTEGSVDLSRLDGLICRLPERARLVFVLYAIEGYRHEEIANTMKTSVGNSKAQFHRAKGLIKTWLEDES